jgi:hypothetical protein
MRGKKASIITGITGVAICLGLVWGFQVVPDHKLLFEKAKFAMETTGDLPGAIKLFQEIVTKYPQEKEHAAKAQLYIGLCYEKLGNSEAVRAYELVLKNFADRPEEVAVARERLAALRQGAEPGESVIKLPLGTIAVEPYEISPDGAKIAGITYEGGVNVAVHDTVTGRTELLTQFDYREGSFWADCPVWSPDGKEIAYELTANKPGTSGSELRVTNLKGDSRLLWSTIDGDIYPEDWLRDGSSIVAVWMDKNQLSRVGSRPVPGVPKPKCRRTDAISSAKRGGWIP